jgi:hypothetical protein
MKKRWRNEEINSHFFFSYIIMANEEQWNRKIGSLNPLQSYLKSIGIIQNMTLFK